MDTGTSALSILDTPLAEVANGFGAAKGRTELKLRDCFTKFGSIVDDSCLTSFQTSNELDKLPKESKAVYPPQYLAPS